MSSPASIEKEQQANKRAVPAAADKSHATLAKQKAAEAGSAASESASEATVAAKETLTEAGITTVKAAESTKEGVQHGAAVAADKTADATAAAKEKLSEIGQKTVETSTAAKEKLTEVGESVQSGVQSAIEYIKEHLPRVEHEEESVEEKRSKALLHEAMGWENVQEGTIDDVLDIRVLPTTTPGKTSPPGVEGKKQEEEVEVVEPPLPPHVTLPEEHRVIQENRSKARALVDSAARTADSALGAPVEMRSRRVEEAAMEGAGGGVGGGAGGVKEEERSAVGLVEAIEDKMDKAKDFARSSSSSGAAHPEEERVHHHHSGTVHEYSALPGDIHIPLIAKAVREKVLHRPAQTTTHHPEDYTSTVQPPTTPTTTPTNNTTAQGVLEDARHRAAEATRVAEEEAKSAQHATSSTLSSAYHKVVDPLSNMLHSAEDSAIWAYEHTKEELLHKSAAETHQEMQPHSRYEEELAHGGIPSSTDKVLSGAVITDPSPLPEKEKNEKEEEGKAFFDEKNAVFIPRGEGTGSGSGGTTGESWGARRPHMEHLSPSEMQETLKGLGVSSDVAEPGSEGEISS